MKLHYLIILCVFIGCKEQVEFFKKYPKDSHPIIIDGKEVFLPLYDEYVEQLHLVGYAQCEKLQNYLKVDAYLLPAPDQAGQCLAIYSISDVVSSDLGFYKEFSIIIPVIRVIDNKQRLGTYMHEMYLTPGSEFSVKVGKEIWGYPKALSENLTFKTKFKNKKIELETKKGAKLSLLWKVRGNFDNTTKEEMIDLITPKGEVAPTALLVYKRKDQVLFDSNLDKFQLTGHLEDFAKEIDFKPVYWINDFLSVVSGINSTFPTENEL